MHDIDDLIADEVEEKTKSEPRAPIESGDLNETIGDGEETGTFITGDVREPVGEIEHFFSKIGVAAIHLSGDLKVGDTIEIGESPNEVRVEVSSMQIDRKDVGSATAGDSIGIKIDTEVSPGSKVYLV
jgi:putative protease